MGSSADQAPSGAAWGWLALGAAGLVVGGLSAAGVAGLLQYLFLPLSVVLGAALLVRPAGFIVFTLGVWIWAPLVRRLADWDTFHHALSPVLAAPVLLTCVALLGHRSWRAGLVRAPALAVLALPLGWGLAIGCLDNGIVPAVYALLAWAGPILFGLYVLGARQRARLDGAVLGGLSLLAFGASLYGLAQFIDPAIWDRRWMINSGMPVLGDPLPFAVRVFGPLNSPVPFAAVMVAGILAAILDPRPWRWFLAPTMLVALLLSLVRSEWIALLVGVAVVALGAGLGSLGRIARMFAAFALVLALGLPLLTYEPIQRVVTRRIESFSAGVSDVSLRDRAILYRTVTFEAPLKGQGLGSTDNATRLQGSRGALDPKHGTVDSGLIQLATAFGLPMAAVYLGVLAAMGAVAALARGKSSWRLCGLAIVAASLSQLPSYNMLISAAAMLLYFGLAMSLPIQESAAMVKGAAADLRDPRLASDEALARA
jgi:hypothetical protein